MYMSFFGIFVRRLSFVCDGSRTSVQFEVCVYQGDKGPIITIIIIIRYNYGPDVMQIGKYVSPILIYIYIYIY